MNDTELIHQVIDNEINILKNDRDVIELKYHSEYVPFEDSKYQDRCIYKLMENGEADRVLSILKRVKKKLSVYESIRTTSFTDDLSYIFAVVDVIDKAEFIAILLDVKYKIEVFDTLKISEKDYTRDMKTLRENHKKIKKYSFIETTLFIPDNKPAIIKKMLMDLDKLSYTPATEDNSDINSIVVTTFFGYERLPRGHNSRKKHSSKKKNKKPAKIIPTWTKTVSPPKKLSPQDCDKHL